MSLIHCFPKDEFVEACTKIHVALRKNEEMLDITTEKGFFDFAKSSDSTQGLLFGFLSTALFILDKQGQVDIKNLLSNLTSEDLFDADEYVLAQKEAQDVEGDTAEYHGA